MHPVICGNCDKKWYAAGHTPVSWFGGWACSRACDIANCIRELLTIQDVERAAYVEGLCRERVDRNWDVMGKAEGVKNGVTREDRRTQPIFYVYVYWIDDTPFYVGKGWGQRSSQHFLPSQWGKGDTLMHRKMAKLIREGHRKDIRIEFFIKDVDEETAFFWEGFLIRALGRRCDRDGTLCNLTWGGDKTNTGYTHSQERRDKISRASHARWRTIEGRKQMLEGMNNRGPLTQEQIENQSRGRKKAGWKRFAAYKRGV